MSIEEAALDGAGTPVLDFGDEGGGSSADSRNAIDDGSDRIIAELSAEITRLKAEAADAAAAGAATNDDELGRQVVELELRLRQKAQEHERVQRQLEQERRKVQELERERELQNRSLQVLHQQLEVERERKDRAQGPG